MDSMKIFLLSLLLSIVVVAPAQQSANVATATDKHTYPSLTLQNPLAPGTWGTVAASVVVQHRTRLANEPDGNAEVYMGLGKPHNAIGGGITVNLYGLTNNRGERDNLGQGAVSMHINRYLFAQRLLLDAGVDNLAIWGVRAVSKGYISYRRSFYLSGNYLLQIKDKRPTQSFGYVSITAGAGNGLFASDAIVKDSSKMFSPFVSIATPLHQKLNFIAEWNGYDVGLGLAFIVSQRFPFQLRSEVTDIRLGKPRVIVALSMPVRYGKTAANWRPMGIKAIRPVRTI